ncbi:Tn7 transposase TnsA N-terminal domain-containing protein [Brevundimonas sp. R86498]|uniref:Tn7 transposase TnsA N-terminal domain-containing protein n=1 Tax=Brevundimonas sp. R86498 TaxID=3093845 RepID=UPI0037C846A5
MSSAAETRLIERALAMQPSSPLLEYQIPPVRRLWLPTIGTGPLIDLRRHPELFPDVLGDYPEVFETRRSRSASRGWQGKLASSKMGRTVRTRSHLELRLCERCEVDGAVWRYLEQPISITYQDGEGKKRRHTPDLYYQTNGVASFVEVKWETDARSEKNEARWPHIAAAITGLGFQYEVLTERHILRRPMADNVALLLRMRRNEPLAVGAAAALEAVLRRGPLTIEEAISALPGTSWPRMLRALADGWVQTDLEIPLTPGSPVSLGRPKDGR